MMKMPDAKEVVILGICYYIILVHSAERCQCKVGNLRGYMT